MAQIPVAADFCWGCSRFHGEVYGTCEANNNFDWNDSESKFKVCEKCRVSRFCSARCMKKSYPAELCAMNRQLIGKSLRDQLHHLRVNV